jgi:hypothetical protein
MKAILILAFASTAALGGALHAQSERPPNPEQRERPEPLERPRKLDPPFAPNRPDRPRMPERPMPPVGPERPMRPTAYLGVVTAPVPPPLAAQLGLKEGFGLLIEHIVPESPAAQGGLQRFDVLTKFEDQQLIDPNQLAILIRSAGKESEAKLTFIRGTKPDTTTVKLGERLLPERRAADAGQPLGFLRERWGDGEEIRRGASESLRSLEERVRDLQRKLQEQLERQRLKDKSLPGDKGAPPPPPPPGGGPAGKPPREVEKRGDDEPNAMRDPARRPGELDGLDSMRARMQIRTPGGAIETVNRNARRIIVVQDAEGREIHRENVPIEERELPVDSDLDIQ